MYLWKVLVPWQGQSLSDFKTKLLKITDEYMEEEDLLSLTKVSKKSGGLELDKCKVLLIPCNMSKIEEITAFTRAYFNVDSISYWKESDYFYHA